MGEIEGVYKLRCNLYGHSKDVRAVATTNDGRVLTASRDAAAKLWSPLSDRVAYEEKQTYTGHSGYVTSICAIPGNSENPDGFVVTGSRDTTILVFPLGGGSPVHTLTGHSDTVSSLFWSSDILISGSWDHSARLWKGWECVYEMNAHAGPVWSVVVLPRPNQGSSSQPPSVLTASADKTIKLWKDGKVCITFKGHKDCVRDLSVMSDTHFLSCSNDASVMLWAVSGECLATYYGHSNFIYSINCIGGSTGFITGGEDRTLRVWRSDGTCVQTIHLPAQSVWAVASLPNSDIVCGTSDGMCRIFSASKECQADAEDQKAFEDSVAKSTMTVGDVGGIKKSDLPGKEALFAPGKRDGHTIMIREGDKVNCYAWSAADQQWSAVGEVVGGAGGSQETSGKVLYEGKEYDFVFEVELDEGTRKKLPYNIREDPYFAAQRFIHQHELPQEFLDQVATFIINNTKGMTLGMEGGGQYVDPFTGGSRYTPESGVPFGGLGSSGSNRPDPFTGSSSYSTQQAMALSSASEFFPQLLPLKFESCNPTGILTKIKESNAILPSESQLSDAVLESLVASVSDASSVDPQNLAPLEIALQWPAEFVWPALDVLRLALRSEKLQRAWLTKDKGLGLVNLLVTLIRPPSSITSQLLALRCLANMASHEPGCCVLAQSREQVVSSAVEISPYANKNMEIAAATLLLNYSVLLTKTGTLEDQCQILSGAGAVAMCSKDTEAQFRSLVALGTLLAHSAECRSLAANLDIKSVVQVLSLVTNPCKVGECAGHILRLL
ncbi:hypothetical protein SK128_004896 [Halocaridina rubra]|uniref:Phospholipase A-2-activating protein n=1 Tax=Halocaridina rubra TaxID=373956 RepID=A0AAN8XLU7_HALRR